MTTGLITGHAPDKMRPSGRSKAAASLDPADFLEAMFLGRSTSASPHQQQQLGIPRPQQAVQPAAAAADASGNAANLQNAGVGIDQHLRRQQQQPRQQQQRLQRQQHQPQQQHQQLQYLQRQQQQRQRCSLSPPPAGVTAGGLANPWSAAKQGAKHLNKGKELVAIVPHWCRRHGGLVNSFYYHFWRAEISAQPQSSLSQDLVAYLIL